MNRRPRAIAVIDLAFGDCGKGTIVDYLVREAEADLVVRFNGGPQAGHNVVLPDGRHHTFAQFGSGSFVPGVRTLLSRFVLVEPYALLNEARHLSALGVDDALDRLTIDARCVVITPPHRAANRVRERLRGSGAHGTCGMGVGEAASDALDHPAETLRAGELADRSAVRAKLRRVWERKRAEFAGWLAGPPDDALAEERRLLTDPAWIDVAADVYAAVASRTTIAEPDESGRLMAESPVAIFEGAQGVLLDERFGFHPHTTWSRTTAANFETLLDECGSPADRERVGVLRTYFTRHGAGPLVTESAALNALPEPHNADTGWQQRFRRGTFDAVAARYAIAAAGGIDSIALAHVDRLPTLPPRLCTGYALAEPEPALFESVGGVVTDIRFDPDATLDRQERLTTALVAARPVETTHDPARGVEAIESAIGREVAILSNGPTFQEKRRRRDRP